MARKSLFWGGILAIVTGALFVPLPFRVTIPVALDIDGTYAVRVQEAGTLTHLMPEGPVEQGDPLATLQNDGIDQDLALAHADLALAELQAEVTQQGNQTQARLAATRLEVPQRAFETLQGRQAALNVIAGDAGLFQQAPAILPGAYLTEGAPLGTLLPGAGDSQLIGQFPETRIARWRQSTPRYALWKGGEVLAHDAISDVELVQINQLSVETGQRSYQLRADVEIAPIDLSGRDLFLKIRMDDAPAYEHLAELFSDLRRSYLDARAEAR